MRKTSPRTMRAIELRDAAMIVLREKMEMIQVRRLPGKMASATIGHFAMSYRTPFQRLPASSAEVKYASALLTQKGYESKKTLPYGLDIWDHNKKVFSFQWAIDDQALEIISFKRGPWETHFLASAASIGSNSG